MRSAGALASDSDLLPALPGVEAEFVRQDGRSGTSTAPADITAIA